MIVDVAKITRTVRQVAHSRTIETIRDKRDHAAAQLAAGRLQHSDLEEALKELSRRLDVLHGAVQAYDDLLATLQEIQQ